MGRICAMLCASVLLLAACVPSTKPVFMQHHDLGAATAGVGTHHAAHAGQGILKIARISVPPWLAGNAMYYRLDYRRDNRLSAYTRSDWVAPPATLLEPIIQNAIIADGDWRAVVGPRNPAAAGKVLHLKLTDFSQAFAQADRSTGVIAVTATLIGNRHGRVIAQRDFHVAVAAPTANAQGGVKALSEASRQLAAHLQRWLHTARRHRPTAK